MAKKAKLMRAYRLREQTVFEIERLSEEWDCTHAEVVERAIRRISESPKATSGLRENGDLKVEYDVE